MKILVCPGDGGACAHYRCYQPYWKLGPDYLVAFTYDQDDPNFKDADALVIPRIHTQLALDVFKKFKASGRICITDFDDNFDCIPWYNPARAFFHEGTPDLERFHESLEVADIVTCSTQYLADAYKSRRDNIFVCPNFISQEHFDAMRPRANTSSPRRPGSIRIGYVGSHTHFGDVALLAEPLTKIIEQYQMPKIQIVFFGYPPVLPLQHRIKAEYYPGMNRMEGESVSDFMLRYYQEIAAMDLDIALAPLVDNEFNRCKSNIKLLEYGICGVPIIASYVGPYGEFSLANSVWNSIGKPDWLFSLERLVEDAAHRKHLASSNLNHIRDNHTTKAAIGAWHTMLERAAVHV